ncbi:integrase core domain protein, partial [Oesophagostomum dentatum]
LKFDDVNLFSDSTIALAWIHSKKRLPSLVTTLTQKIQLSRERISCYQPVHIYHVRTEENVADYATRGLTREEAHDHVWFKGPNWLNRDQCTWPVRPVEEFSQKEKEDCFGVFTANQEVGDHHARRPRIWPTERISSYDKLKRITAYSLRFIRSISKGKIAALEDQSDHLDFTPNAQEMTLAENYLLREEQQQTNLQILMKSCENVKIDSKGLARKFGRLQNSDLCFDTVNRIYLPRKGLINQSIAEQLHKNLCHCGSNQLVQALRKKFWIPADKVMCRKILRSCSICQRYNAVPYKYPQMGPLPVERVTKSPPFSFTGVDLMGPLTIKNVNNENEKRYVALFTCLVTRMVHLELATDLSARSFLLVFKRFVSRRGVPLKIISDNGTNFRLSETILRRNDPPTGSEFSLFIAKHNIQWTFIPPASPWMGGAWERMVGTVKRALSKTMGRRKASEEVLTTFLCEVESAVNSRPLTTVGRQEDTNELTSFARTFAIEVIPLEEQCQDYPTYRPTPEIANQIDPKRAITEAEKLTAHFGTKWKTEYLIKLRDHHVLYGGNYKSPKQVPQIGDIVLIDDDLQISKNHWPVGLIRDFITSRDGKIRSAVLRTGTGRCIQQPLNQLIPIEISAREEEALPSNHERVKVPEQPMKDIEPVRKRSRLERKAKKPVNYRENITVVRRNSLSNSSALSLALVACSLLSSATAQVLSCTRCGVLVDTRSVFQ